jgi:phosphohistidine phosphatase
MKNLFLLRHAKSGWEDPQIADFHRPLSKRGVSNALLLSNYILKNGITFDLVLSSPSERTQATLDLALAERSNLLNIRLDQSIYCGEAITLLNLIKLQDDSQENILLIGHNPGLQMLAESLIRQRVERLGTCSFLKFSNFDSWKDLDSNILDLKFFITPKDLIND